MGCSTDDVLCFVDLLGVFQVWIVGWASISTYFHIVKLYLPFQCYTLANNVSCECMDCSLPGVPWGSLLSFAWVLRNKSSKRSQTSPQRPTWTLGSGLAASNVRMYLIFLRTKEVSLSGQCSFPRLNSPTAWHPEPHSDKPEEGHNKRVTQQQWYWFLFYSNHFILSMLHGHIICMQWHMYVYVIYLLVSWVWKHTYNKFSFRGNITPDKSIQLVCLATKLWNCF